MYDLIMPRNIFSGENSIQSLKEVIIKEKIFRVLILTDSGIASTDLPDLVLENIPPDTDSVVMSNIVPEPSYEQVQKIIDDCRAYNPDFIIALGGGSVIDTAKLASLLIRSPLKVKNLLADPLLLSKSIKMLAIPTTAGTGAEATPNAIVAVPEERMKVGIVNRTMIPDYVILDPVVLSNIPKRVAASTGIDALCHAIECFTGNKANRFSDFFALESLSLILNNIEKCLNDHTDIVAREKMLLASFYAGVAITSSGTTAVHALSYPLGGRYHIAHGISNAILLVPVMKFNEDAIRDRLAIVYDKCIFGGLSAPEEKSQAVIARLEEITDNAGVPKNLEDFGVVKDDIDDLVDSAMKVTRLLSNNAKPVGPADAVSIYSEIL